MTDHHLPKIGNIMTKIKQFFADNRETITLTGAMLGVGFVCASAASYFTKLDMRVVDAQLLLKPETGEKILQVVKADGSFQIFEWFDHFPEEIIKTA